MSKNSNKKQLNSRLNNVFSDIDKPQVFPGLDASSDITGWIWEMSPQGTITGCSPDIEHFLEIPANRLIGTKLTSFSDFSLETANLPSDPNRALMPTTISINFLREDGSVVPTTTYMLGKLDEDGNLLSWRGITSVLESEETPSVEEPEAEEITSEPEMGMVTSDDFTEIPQPDETVMDIWAHNERVTAPLSPEDLIKVFTDEAQEEEIEETSLPAPQDEIETIRYSSSPVSEDPSKDFAPQAAESESEARSSEEKEAEPVEAERITEAPAPSAPIETLDEPAPEAVTGDEIPDLEPHIETEVLPLEGITSEATTGKISEVSAPAEVEGMDETLPEKPPEMAPQDEIETIRYTSYPVTQDQIKPAEITPKDIEPTAESLSIEEEMAIDEEPLQPEAVAEPSEASVWEPEIAEDSHEQTATFIPLGDPVKVEPEEVQQPAPPASTDPVVEEDRYEHAPKTLEEAEAWTPEFVDQPTEALDDAQQAIGQEIDEALPLEPAAEVELEEDELQPVEAAGSPGWAPEFSGEPVEETPLAAPPAYPPGEIEGVIERFSTEGVEEPVIPDEMLAEPLEASETSAWKPEFEQPTEEASAEKPGAEEPTPGPMVSMEPDTQPLRPFEESTYRPVPRTDIPINRIESARLMSDLDLPDDEHEGRAIEGDSVSHDPLRKPPGTGPIRRPTIDTASLIPSLLSDSNAPAEQPPDSDRLSINDLLREVEEDKLRIKTKELETLTSTDGKELSISRGVQELLKIVDNTPNREWKEDELQLVEQVHTQLELALENANLFQQTQIALSETDERARQLRLLNQMSEEISQTDDLLEIYRIVTDKTIQIFNGQVVSITILTDDRTQLEIVTATGGTSAMPIGSQFPLKDTSNEIVVRENRVFIPSGNRSLDLGEMQSTIIGPITVSNKVIGTLNIGSRMPNAFNDRDANFLTQLLSIMNASVENRRLFEQIQTALSTTEEQARRLAVLNQLSEKLTLADRFEKVISLILDHINQIIPADEWAYTHVNVDKNTYELFVAEAKLADLPTMGGSPISMTQPLENSIVGKATKDRRTIIEFNCLDSTYQDVRLWAEERGVRTAMSSPIIVGNQVLGVLNVGSKQISAYTAQEENIMLSITSLAGSTIDNRQLLGQIQKRSIQLETSAEVSRVASTMLDPTELLPRVVELIKDGFNLYYAGIFLIDEGGEITGEPNKWAVLRAGSGEAGQQMIGTGHKLEIGGDSMIGTAISTSQARIALSVGEEARFFRNPFLPNTRSEMALPLISRGEALGALSIQSETEDAFNQEDITALQTMADQLANAIENARLFEQTEMRAEELTVLNEMARGFTQSMEINDLIENTYQFTGRLMDANNFYIVLYYPDEEFYEFKLFVEDGQKMPPPRTRVKLANGLTDWIIKNKLPVLIPTNTETHLKTLGVEPRDRIPKSWLGVPMLLGNEVTGVIAVQSYLQANTYNSHSLDLLIAVSSQAAVAIDNARRFQATQTRARHEEILRRVTTQVHSTSDPEAILRTAVREVSDALGKPAFVKLNPQEKPSRLHLDADGPTKSEPIPPKAPANPQPPVGGTEER